MKRILIAFLVLAIVAGTFTLGYLCGRQRALPADSATGRTVLYYVDPMNPAHTSDKPGLAPCGMKMEPVYAETLSAPGAAVNPAALPPGAVILTPQKQQLIGVKVGLVEKKPLQHDLRLLGRVAIDETRIYRINATVDGWIIKALPFASGRPVKKDETLATFYSSEFLSAGQALLYALAAKDRAIPRGTETPAQKDQISQFNLNLRQYKDSLRNLGMGDLQIEEMIRTREYMENVNITAPAGGFIIARNVSDGQRFDKGTELFRIADLSKVWILADVFENEEAFARPGLKVRVFRPGSTAPFTATLTRDLPEFSAASRTLKLRFEADNPDFALKPDMFVDVELPITLPEAVVIPTAAMLDAGVRKVVFIERSKGVFEPRQIAIGRQFGDQVQVLQGLSPGERVVTSGTFLLDSESRMKLAAAGVQGPPAADPVCHMTVDIQKAKAAGRFSQFQGVTYYFCGDACKHAFDADPAKVLENSATKATAMAPMNETAADSQVRDPVCGMVVDLAKAKAANRFATYMLDTYYFCSDGCKKSFEATPVKYVENSLHGYYLDPPTNMPAAVRETRARDPVCGMTVHIEKAKAAKRVSVHQSKTYYFCNDGCKAEFDSNPGEYVKEAASK